MSFSISDVVFCHLKPPDQGKGDVAVGGDPHGFPGEVLLFVNLDAQDVVAADLVVARRVLALGIFLQIFGDGVGGALFQDVRQGGGAGIPGGGDDGLFQLLQFGLVALLQVDVPQGLG